MTDFKKIKVIERINKNRILLQVNVGEESGIYVFYREDDIGLKYCYVGQAKHLLTRLAQHLSGYNSHIDLSLKNRGFENEKPFGWKLKVYHCEIDALDDMEKYYLKVWANNGYIPYNKTSGGQGSGKVQIAEYKPSRGYRDGVKQGYNKARKEIKTLFDKYLYYAVKADNFYSRKAFNKFEEFLKGEEDDTE